MSGDFTPYTALITSEHASKPNFLAVMGTLLQPLADGLDVVQSIPGLYDLDNAEGDQLDTVGLWVGVSRALTVPLSGVYFSLDSTTLGLDQGYLQGPYDPTTGVVSLDDGTFRILMQFAIAANNWDGTIPGAYRAWNGIFPSGGAITFVGAEPIAFVGSSNLSFGLFSTLLIQDNQDMTMYLAVIEQNITAINLALIQNGYIRLKPAGVQITYMIQSVDGDPIFGLDVEGSTIAGLDNGAFATILAST
jgi:hypothetical protein